jgi:hypothetical protein
MSLVVKNMTIGIEMPLTTTPENGHCLAGSQGYSLIDKAVIVLSANRKFAQILLVAEIEDLEARADVWLRST